MTIHKSSQNDNDRASLAADRAIICPFLGLRKDSQTCVNYPSDWNCCYRCSPLAIPVFSQQKDFCLTPEHQNCVVFKSKSGLRMPSNLLHQEVKQNKVNRKLFLLLIPLILASALFLIQRFLGFQKQPGVTATGNPIGSANQVIPTQLFEPLRNTETALVLDPTSTTTPTNFPTLSPTATPTRMPNQLDIPIGRDYKFIIHKAAEGESIQQFAQDYRTTSDAIKAVNYEILIPIWIDSALVIPWNFSDVSGYPPFSPIMVESELQTLTDIAQKYDCSVEELAFYNGLEPGETLFAGEWLLVPRERPNY